MANCCIFIRRIIYYPSNKKKKDKKKKQIENFFLGILRVLSLRLERLLYFNRMCISAAQKTLAPFFPPPYFVHPDIGRIDTYRHIDNPRKFFDTFLRKIFL